MSHDQLVYPFLKRFGSYQIEILAGFGEEKTLHSVFQTHIEHIVNSGIATLGFGVCVQTLDDFAAHV